VTASESANRVWRKSTASQPNGDCLEVGLDGSAVRVRDSRNRSGTVLSFKRADWQAFLVEARRGEFDIPWHS
jgi:uncharacterized protein DUF397